MSGYKNQYDKSGECSFRGNKAETKFFELMKKRDPLTVLASTQRNIKCHEDIISPKFGSFDVKSARRVNRSSDIQYETIWIEYKNVKGQDGWLFGSADFIAFEREKDFVVVNRKDLIKLCKFLVYEKRFVNSAKDALYKMYTRQDRKDVLTRIKISDVLELSSTYVLTK